MNTVSSAILQSSLSFEINMSKSVKTGNGMPFGTCDGNPKPRPRPGTDAPPPSPRAIAICNNTHPRPLPRPGPPPSPPRKAIVTGKDAKPRPGPRPQPPAPPPSPNVRVAECKLPPPLSYSSKQLGPPSSFFQDNQLPLPVNPRSISPLPQTPSFLRVNLPQNDTRLQKHAPSSSPSRFPPPRTPSLDRDNTFSSRPSFHILNPTRARLIETGRRQLSLTRYGKQKKIDASSFSVDELGNLSRGDRERGSYGMKRYLTGGHSEEPNVVFASAFL